MIIRLNYQALFFALFIMMSLPVVAFADVAIVANKSITSNSVTIKQAKKIFLGKTKSMPGGGVVKLADLPTGNPVRKELYRTIVKKKESQLKAYWAKKSFTGKGFPPKLFDSEDELMEWVAQTKGAIGYVSIGAVNDSVKVLLKK